MVKPLRKALASILKGLYLRKALASGPSCQAIDNTWSDPRIYLYQIIATLVAQVSKFFF